MVLSLSSFREIFKALNLIRIKFIKDSCMVRASGLAYSTLLSSIPFITVIYAFGGFDSLGHTLAELVLNSMIPSQQAMVMDAINNFTRNSVATGTVGMIFFMITSLFLINGIAINMDTIWGVNKEFDMFRRFTTYTAVIVFSSLLLGISSSVTSIIEEYITSLIKYDEEFRGIGWFTPFAVTTSVFFLMIIVIPSVRIKISSAVIGALVSTMLFEVVKLGFRTWVVSSTRNSVIYGSLAVIPIILMGLYLFWLIVLIGAEVTYYIEHLNDPSGGNPSEMKMDTRLSVALDIFLVISGRYIEGSGGVTIRSLERELGVPGSLIDHFITIFRDNNLILKTVGRKATYIPARSLDNIRISDVFNVIYGQDVDYASIHNLAKVSTKAFSNGGYSAIDGRSILEILNEDRGIEYEKVKKER